MCLIGYTNAGKSTILNALTHSDVLAENKLFATLDTKACAWKLEKGTEVLLSDTVGFVRDLPHNGDDVAITRAVIAMAHSLKMSVVAEGVEEQGQFDLLRAEGCDEFQGFLCQPALEERDLMRFFAEEKARPPRAPTRKTEPAGIR